VSRAGAMNKGGSMSICGVRIAVLLLVLGLGVEARAGERATITSKGAAGCISAAAYESLHQLIHEKDFAAVAGLFGDGICQYLDVGEVGTIESRTWTKVAFRRASGVLVWCAVEFATPTKATADAPPAPAPKAATKRPRVKPNPRNEEVFRANQDPDRIASFSREELTRLSSQAREQAASRAAREREEQPKAKAHTDDDVLMARCIEQRGQFSGAGTAGQIREWCEKDVIAEKAAEESLR